MYLLKMSKLFGIFSILTIGVLLIDIFFQHKYNGSEITTKEAFIWSAIWVFLAFLFSFILWYYFKITTNLTIANIKIVTFLSAYLLEKILAIDNIFVWLMLFNYFSIPVSLQRRVLVFGVFGAIVLRSIMIFLDNWLVSEFHWISYFFGVFLLLSGLKIFFLKKKPESFNKKKLVKLISSRLRITSSLHEEHFFIRKNGILFGTPLILVLVLIEISDIIFAIDSIPSVFSITKDPFIVLTSNLFAILGLRSMYFLLLKITEKFFLFKKFISLILVFVGLKMIFVDFVYLSAFAVFLIILGILLLAFLINYIIVKFNKKNNKIFFN